MLPNAKRIANRKPKPGNRGHAEILDLHSQLEELLNQVWRCEADWRFDDRLALGQRQAR
jgi:hypothetical protein